MSNLDALGLAEDWAKAGLPPETAREMARALANRLTATLATKDDLRALEVSVTGRIGAMEVRLDSRIDAVEARLDGRIGAVEARLDGRIDAVEARIGERIQEARADIIKWVAGLLIVQAGVIVALIRLLPGAGP